MANEKSEIDAQVDAIFDLLSSTEVTSNDGLERLQDWIEKSKHSLRPSTSEDSPWLDSVETKITTFMTTKPYNPNKQRSALIALDLLIKNQVRLKHYTRHLGTITSIRPSTDIKLQEHAASTLGKLHQASGNKFTQSAEYQIRIFFEFLNHFEDDTQMLQSVLMLKEIAISMPSLFIGKAEGDNFFSRIVPAFKGNSETRTRGAALLNVVIRLYAMREVKDPKRAGRQENRNWAHQVYKNFKTLAENLTNEVDSHGAILMLHELVSVANKDEIGGMEKKLQDYHSGSFAPLRKLSINILPVEKFEALLDSNQTRKELPKNVHSKVSRKEVTSHYDEICNLVLSIMLYQPSNKDANLRNSLINLIPRLAAVDPNAFECHKIEGPVPGHPGLKKIFHESLTYLIESYSVRSQSADRRIGNLPDDNADVEIRSLALLIQIMGKRVVIHKERILKLIGQIFAPEPLSLKRGAKATSVSMGSYNPPASAYALIACFVQALHYSLKESEMTTLVDHVMKHGLNRYVALCLHDICSNAPLENFQFKLDIKNRLFTELYSRIVRFEIKFTEEISATGQTANLKSSRKISSMSVVTSASNLSAEGAEEVSSSVIMALNILAAFDFTGVALASIVSFCADKLMNYEKSVRLAASKACCNLLISDDASFLLDTNRAKTALYESDKILRTTLPKIINIGVTDPSYDVRLAIVSSLDSRFDPFLAQVDNLNSLFIALYDENFRVREYIVCILGRLSEANAAYVMPALRKFLLQLLKELQYTEVPKARERCSVLLGNLLYNTPRLLSAYMESVMNCLIPKLIAANEAPVVNSTDLSVAVSFMRTIGILAEVSGRDIGAYFHKLMPTILDFIKDTQNNKRKIAGLWTLGNLVFSAGNVVQPCIDYPELLELLLDMIKSEVSVAVRNQTIKVLGSLGPLDPYVYKTILQPAMYQSLRLAEKETENSDPNLSELTSMIETAVMDEVYPAVATDALLKILNDPNQCQYWPRVIDGFRLMIVSMGIKSVSFIWRVIPAYLNVLQNMPANTEKNKMSELVLISLTKIVNTVKDHIRPYLKDIVECLSQVWSLALEKNLIELLGYLAKFVGSDFKQHYYMVLPKVIEVIKRDVKTPNPVVKSLIESFRTYGVMLEGYIHIILPAVMGCLESTNQTDLKIEICTTLIYFCEKMDMTDYSSLMIHSLLRVVEYDQSSHKQSYAGQTSTSSPATPSGQAPTIATSAGTERTVTNRVFDVLAAICFILKHRFLIFRPIVEQVVEKYKISHLNYLFVLDNIDHMFYSQAGKYRSDIGARVFERKSRSASPVPANEVSSVQKYSIESELPMLKRSWSTEGKVSKDDWLSWFKNLSFMLLNKSPSRILRGCSSLDHAQLRKDLFNVAFLSCWVELDQLHQDELIKELKNALEFENAPELTLAILNLAEFMEHSEKGPLPLDHLLLGKVAEKNGAYAKALYYRESALMSHEPGSKEIPEILESLLHVNTKLQNYDAATGVLKLAPADVVDESWYESLGQWENALKKYNNRVGSAVEPKHVIGKMRCLEGMAEWEELHQLVKDVWGRTDYLTNDYPEMIGDLGVKACWALQNWDEMNTYISALPSTSLKQTYYKAAYSLHRKENFNAMRLIQECRDLVDNDLTTLVKESYSRAYGTLVELKHFSEMEEVISYNFLRPRQESIKQMWRDRLLGGQPNVHDWQSSLLVHSLAIRPEDNEVTLLKFAGLCMRQNKMKISFKVLQSLIPDIEFPSNQKLQEMTDPEALDREIGDMTERLADSCATKISVVYMFLKQLWEVHRRNDLVKRRLIQSLGMITSKVMGLYAGMFVPDILLQSRRYDNGRGRQVARFCLLYASWQKSFGINIKSITEIIANCQYATENCKNWYKAWRMLAESSAEAFKLMRANGSINSASTMPGGSNTLLLPSLSAPQLGPVSSLYTRTSSSGRSFGSMSGVPPQMIPNDPVRCHFLVAVNAFVKSIRCCWDKKKDTLQDTLRLLTLLFENPNMLDTPDIVLDTLKQVHVDVWLQVIPQLIARVASARSGIGKIIIPLLVDIGKAHPHAAVYSLMVGAKSTSSSRASAVQTVLDAMKDRYPEIVKQAQILSHELIRVSILWHELWHEGLEVCTVG